jgi:hypothetical protein
MSGLFVRDKGSLGADSCLPQRPHRPEAHKDTAERDASWLRAVLP